MPVVDVEGLRPTSDRVRETLFNWLNLWLPGKRCLDLYAGTGALGLEALSRGARDCVFVEKDRRAADMLRQNIETLDAGSAVLMEGDATRLIETLEQASVDLVFLDPPFAGADMSGLCRRLDESGILASGARVYLEEDRAAPETALPTGWQTIKSATAGNVRYSLATTGAEQ